MLLAPFQLYFNADIQPQMLLRDSYSHAACAVLVLGMMAITGSGGGLVNAAPSRLNIIDSIDSLAQQQLIFNSPAARVDDRVHRALSSLADLASALPPLEMALLLEHIHLLPEKRLVALSSGPEDVYEITEGEKALLTYHGVRFVDVTGYQTQEDVIANKKDDPKHLQNFPEKLQYGRKELEKRFYGAIDTARMKTFLSKFSSFRTRWSAFCSAQTDLMHLLTCRLLCLIAICGLLSADTTAPRRVRSRSNGCSHRSGQSSPPPPRI